MTAAVSVVPVDGIVAVIDTNVMLDVFGCFDLERAYEAAGASAAATDARTRFRRARARWSFLLAIWLHRSRCKTFSLGPEALAMMGQLNAPSDSDSLSYAYTALMVNFVVPRVLSGWRPMIQASGDPGVRKMEADRFLLDTAHASRVPLISWEGLSHTGVIDIAKEIPRWAAAEGKEAVMPHVFLRGRLGVHLAVRNFLDDFERKAPVYAVGQPNAKPLAEALQIMGQMFRHFLLGEGADGPVDVSLPAPP